MSVIDDVRRLKASGQSDQAIMNSLRQQGVSDREISDAVSQADIKEAVSNPIDGRIAGRQKGQVQQQMQEQDFSGGQGMYEPPQYQGEQQVQEQAPMQQEGYEGMEPSMAAGGGYQDYGAGGEIGGGGYDADKGYGAGGGYGDVGGGYGGGGYPEYQQYQEGMSSDVITEIAEQVVSEKMAQMRESLERTLDFRTVAEARIESLNERLRRMEKIIDKLQLSILEKVGEYLGDVKNLKKELVETQKSFKAVNRKKI